MAAENTHSVLRDIASQLPNEYAVIEFVGEGGHGIVLKALHKTLQQNVALKIIKADRSDETNKRIERIQNEAKILAKLQHKNIVRVLQLGKCLDETPFLVCEFLEGITLAQYLKKSPQPSPRMILDVFTQILDALSCAHDNGLLHRDIKPSNIMLVKDPETETYEVKLLDFGIARNFEEVDSQPMGLTRTIQISGSAPYMSPEQCKGERIGPSSDIYSVACVLFECLAGHPPFAGETPIHTRFLQINEDPEIPINDKFAQTSSRAALYRLTLQGLSKSPQNRPPTALEFKSALMNALPNAQNRTSWTLKKRWPNKKLAISLSLLAAISTVFFFVAWKQSNTHKISTPPESVLSKSNKPQVRAVTIGKEGRMKDLVDRFMSYTYEPTPESTKIGLQIREELIDLIKTIRKSDIALNYTARREKAMLEFDMGFYSEARKSLIDLLNYCKTPNNETSVEAIECYMKQAEIAMALGEFSEAENCALKGVALQNGAPDGVLSPIDIPAFYELRDQNRTAECYSILADIAHLRKDYVGELPFREKAEEARRKKERIDIHPEYNIKLLNAALQANGMKDALGRASTLYNDYRKQFEAGPAEGELATSFSELGLWYFKQGFLREAQKCYGQAKEVFALVEPSDHEGPREQLKKRLAELDEEVKTGKMKTGN